mgnify:CR=1 FL=1
MKNLKLMTLCAGAALTMLSSCKKDSENAVKEPETPTAESFVKTGEEGDTVLKYNDKDVKLFELSNASGMKVKITNFGGRIVSLLVPDKDGNLKDVVLGFDTAQEYFPENNATDFGASIGRYANRLNQGKIVCDGDTIQLPKNNYGHCLHGGPTGWQYQVYDGNQLNDSTLELTLVSPDGDNNFPGEVTAKVTYTLTSDNAVEIQYEATTDKETVINMTNHSYFNLSGDPNNTILDEELTIDADGYTPVDSTFMTTGEIRPVEGTAFDFRKAKKIGQDIDSVSDVQLLYARGNSDIVPADKGGYDHNWVLNTKGDQTKPCVWLFDPRTCILLTVYTNEPGIQIYTGNFQDGTIKGKQGITYTRQCAICLETQKYPDSPNKPEWQAESNAYLKPGEVYKSYCKFQFSVEKKAE